MCVYEELKQDTNKSGCVPILQSSTSFKHSEVCITYCTVLYKCCLSSTAESSYCRAEFTHNALQDGEKHHGFIPQLLQYVHILSFNHGRESDSRWVIILLLHHTVLSSGL